MISADELFKIAQDYLPGGVDATVRMNRILKRPFYISRGDGSHLYDLESKSYLDFCMSHGASLLGHNHPAIVAAVKRALDLGVICSYETTFQVNLAKKITQMVPGAELVRFAGSGTETISHALRLARSVTGREKIIKFEGHFHGYSDDLYFSSAPPLKDAGPVNHPYSYPQSAGIPKQNSERIIIVPFNDPSALQMAFEKHGADVAALIMEPVNYDSCCIIPKPGFLQLCRQLCDKYGALLFFDEVLTAFRMAPGGAQQYFGVIPDIAVLGKAIGGGMPISAITGKREVMSQLRPGGNSEHSGTYIAHLTAVLASLAALEQYSQADFYPKLERLGSIFYGGFQEIIKHSRIPVQLQFVGARFGILFGISEEVTNYRQAAQQDYKLFDRFVAGCLDRGLYFHISPHHGFSTAHTEEDIHQSLNIIEEVFKTL